MKEKKATKIKEKENSKDRAKANSEDIQENDLFSLKDILHFGGEKSDYDWLSGINEDEEVLTKEDTQEPDKNLQKELKDLLKDLTFGNSKIDNTEKDTEKVTKKEKKKLKEKSTTTGTESNDKTKSVADEKKKFPVKEFKFAYKKRSQILLRDCRPWYEQVVKLLVSTSNLSAENLQALHETATQYWEDEAAMYQAAKDGDHSSDSQWLRTVLKSGTQSDKVAALIMVTQESPIHCLRSIEALIHMSQKKSRREALIAIDSLRHLWISDLLPDTKLQAFTDYEWENLRTKLCPDGSEDMQVKTLILCAFQHKIKQLYEQYVDTVELLSKDSLADIRKKILGTIYELLAMKPEQEKKLLSMLVNKLGDPDKKIASKATYLLSQLVLKHPNMKEIVIEEIERMIYRPNVPEKAQYYAICFLNQIVLSKREKKIASKLINIHFTFFKILSKKEKTKKSEAQDIKLISALLTGVNRAFPYTEGEEENFDEQLNTLFRLTHVSHLSTSIQAFMLIYQVMESRQTVSDRYYKALYEKLLDIDLKTSAKHTMLLNLVFKSVKNDPIPKRIKAFFKRLLQICTKEDPSFTCGVLFLLSEVMKEKPSLRSLLDQPEADDDEEEKFVDAPDNEEGDQEEKKKEEESVAENEKCEEETSSSKKGHAWTFVNNGKENTAYSISQRNPLFSNAELCCSWEIVPLSTHFHPSVAHFANTIIKGEGDGIFYKGDPLKDFTLIRFLDRFMYRNPKKNESEHGNSVMQPRESSARLREEPVNSKLFLHAAEEKVRVDEMFFHRYFKQKESSAAKNNLADDTTKNQDEDDIEDFEDFDFAGELKKKKPKTDEESSGESEDEEEGGFDYADMSDQSEDDFKEGSEKKNFNDKDYEDALFSNLNSDGESIDGGEDAPVEGESDLNSLFAAADEFSHMLDQQSGGVNHPKQVAWEENKGRQKGRNIPNNKKRPRPKQNNNKRPQKKAKK